METLIAHLNTAGVRYVAIGGQAVRLHGFPRFSMDWDLLIPAHDTDNFRRLNQSLGDSLGELVLPLGEQGQNFVQTFQTSFGVVQFHLAIPGEASYEEIESASVQLPLEDGTLCRVLSIVDLLKSKLASNRSQDQMDIEFLKEKLNSLKE